MDKYYVLIRRKHSDNTGDNLTIILCFLPENPLTPFVTWLENSSRDNPYTINGHYFGDLSMALDDFNTRH